MGNTKIMKRVLAGILAAMIGFSALGGLIMAFAAPSEADEDMPYAINEGIEYIPADEDWEHISLETTGDVTVYFDDKAKLVIPEGITDYLWLGWTAEYNNRIAQLGEQYKAQFDVIDFTFVNTFDKDVTMTIYSKKPYLYRVTTKGDLVAVTTEYKDGAHTFTTDIIDTFVASDSKIAL